jgi:hypothetical protein
MTRMIVAALTLACMLITLVGCHASADVGH